MVSATTWASAPVGRLDRDRRRGLLPTAGRTAPGHHYRRKARQDASPVLEHDKAPSMARFPYPPPDATILRFVTGALPAAGTVTPAQEARRTGLTQDCSPGLPDLM